MNSTDCRKFRRRGAMPRGAAIVVGCLLLVATCAACSKVQSPAGAATSGSRASSAAALAKGPPLDGLCFSPFLRSSPSGLGTDAASAMPGLITTVKPYTKGIRTFDSTNLGAATAQTARAAGLFVAGGCDIEGDPARNDQQVAGVIDEAQKGSVQLAVVGEESLYFNYVSEQQLIDYLTRVKQAGVQVTTSDTWGEIVGHPNVVNACDVVMANMFPYWENQPIGKSISYLNSCYQKVKRAAKGKQVIIETGWPSAGQTKGAAVASPQNAAWFLKNFRSWASAHKVSYYYFEAFDEQWKAGSAEGEVGAHWGIWDSNGVLKPGMAAALK